MAASELELEQAVVSELLAMGYSDLSPEQLEQIKQEFLRLDESNDDESLFSHIDDVYNFDETLMNPMQSIETYLQTPIAGRTGFGADFTNLHADGLDPMLVAEFNELMQMGYDRLQKLYDEIVKMDELLEEQENRKNTPVVGEDQPGPSRRRWFFPTDSTNDEVFLDANGENLTPTPMIRNKIHSKPRVYEVGLNDVNFDAFSNLAQSTPIFPRPGNFNPPSKPAQKPQLTNWKTTKSLEMRRAQAKVKIQETEAKKNMEKLKLNLNPEEEKKLLQLYFKEHALRPIQNSKPGELPYKNDPVSRYERYKQFWEKFPAPGDEKLEKERLKLRWKIRDLMMKWDRPVVRLQLKPTEQNQFIQPEWRA